MRGVKTKSSDVVWVAGDDGGVHCDGDHHCVFVVAETPDGPVKIGSTTDPRRRLMDLQAGNYRKLLVYDLKWAPPLMAELLEQQTIRILTNRGKALGGSWFDVSVSETEPVFEEAATSVAELVNFTGFLSHTQFAALVARPRRISAARDPPCRVETNRR